MSAGECLNVFARRTVFVVGAGASAEFGLPLGSAVASEIELKLYFGRDETGRLSRHHGDPELWRVVQNHAGRAQMDAYLAACHEIRSGLHLADSIDRFIDFNRNNPAI